MDELQDPRRRGIATKVALVVAGVAAGGILAGTLTAQAATSPTPSASSTSGSSTTTDPVDTPEGQEHHGGGDLSLSGTVTAVGTGSVTIRTSSGTTTYTVSSSSDIDKNGEAQLSNLAVGDAVTFSLTGTTIDKLHAGTEALDRPDQPDATGTAGA